MNKINSLIFLSFFVALIWFKDVYPQEIYFNIARYTNEDGVPSNLVKAITCDSSNFIWFASDAGVSKYNGINFKTFTKGFPSLYVKDLIVDDRKRLVLLNDMGAGWLKKTDNGYKYKSLVEGSTNPAEDLLHYPKEIMQDSKGRYWISDLNTISLYIKDTFQKYNFPGKYLLDSFNDSFKLLEAPKGRIIALSLTGHTFIYDYRGNEFQILKSSINGEITDINSRKNELYFSTSDGIYKVAIDFKNFSADVVKVLSSSNIDRFKIDNYQNFFIYTNDNTIYYYDKKTDYFSRVSNEGLSDVKDMMIDSQNNLWIGYDDGIALIYTKFFGELELSEYFGENSRPFIRKVSEGRKGVYFAAYDRLFYTESPLSKNKILKEINFNEDSGIYDFVINNECIWISYYNGKLACYSYEHDEKHSLELGQNRLNQISIDGNGNLWGYDENDNKLVKYNPENGIQRYSLPNDSLINIQSIKPGPGNYIYFSGSSKKFLFSKVDTENGEIEDLITQDVKEDFDSLISSNATIFDFEFLPSNTVMLASDQGLFRLDTSLTRVNLEKHNNALIRTIHKTRDNNLWLGTERGLFYYDTKKSDVVFLYSREGLPNSTISKNGLAIDQNGKLWVGTASGIAYNQFSEDGFRKLNTPKRLSVNSNEDFTLNDQGISTFAVGANLRLTFASTDYPTHRTRYKFRIPETDSNWTSNNQNNYIFFPDLNSGRYTVEVMAKKPGYFWSDKNTFTFAAQFPWYLSNTAVASYFVILIFLIVWIVYGIQKAKIKRMKENEAELQKIVDEKTKDLQRENRKVEKLLEESEHARAKFQNANAIKGQLLSIAAHDLKNPLQSILGYEFILDEDLDEETREIFDSIFQAAKKMLNIITEILDTASKDIAEARLKTEHVNISDLVYESINDFKTLAGRKSQKFDTDLDESVYCNVDKFWLTEAIDNLISNAVKYSPHESTIMVKLQENEGNALLEIIDQGPGLSEEDQEKLFGKFQRLSTQPTGGESSSGLGLFIVKYIIEKHGGEVGVESKQGKGSNFFIKLQC